MKNSNYVVTEVSADEFEHIELETVRKPDPRVTRQYDREWLMRDICSTEYAVIRA